MEPIEPAEPAPPLSSGTPPPLSGEPPLVPGGAKPIARWRWWIHIIVLALYPIALGLLGVTFQSRDDGPTLKADVAHLTVLLIDAVLVFGFFFALAWAASRATKDQLLLRLTSLPRAVGLGLVLSVALRLLVMVFLMALVVVTLATGGAAEGGLKSLRPRTEALIDVQALVDNPLYFGVNLTVISFVVAGFREELWRSGVLAGFTALFPGWTSTWRGKGGAIGLTALLFGLGHLPQGPGAVLLTAVLGAGLGAIMLWRRSIWEAVFAHGFFDATTFLMLYLLQRFAPSALSGGT